MQMEITTHPVPSKTCWLRCGQGGDLEEERKVEMFCTTTCGCKMGLARVCFKRITT